MQSSYQPKLISLVYRPKEEHQKDINRYRTEGRSKRENRWSRMNLLQRALSTWTEGSVVIILLARLDTGQKVAATEGNRVCQLFRVVVRGVQVGLKP